MSRRPNLSILQHRHRRQQVRRCEMRVAGLDCRVGGVEIDAGSGTRVVSSHFTPAPAFRRRCFRFHTGSPNTCSGSGSTGPPGTSGRGPKRRSEISQSYITTTPTLSARAEAVERFEPGEGECAEPLLSVLMGERAWPRVRRRRDPVPPYSHRNVRVCQKPVGEMIVRPCSSRKRSTMIEPRRLT